MLDPLLSIFAPHICLGCDRTGTLLCETCKYDIISEPNSQCLRCLTPTSPTNLCRKCAASVQYDNAWCASERSGVLRSLIDSYKFHSAREAGAHITDILDHALPEITGDFTIVPVPTATAHVRSRGIDHTDYIARSLSSRRGLPYIRALGKTGSTTQHYLNRKERLLQASKGLFVRGKVPNKVLLIDDIYTTGATVDVCTKKLLENGAEQVYVAIVARQMLDE